MLLRNYDTRRSLNADFSSLFLSRATEKNVLYSMLEIVLKRKELESLKIPDVSLNVKQEGLKATAAQTDPLS